MTGGTPYEYLRLGCFDQERINAPPETRVRCAPGVCPPFPEEFRGGGKRFLAGTDPRRSMITRNPP